MENYGTAADRCRRQATTPPADFAAASNEPVVLAPQTAPNMEGAAVRVARPPAAGRRTLRRGRRDLPAARGRRPKIITTLDWQLQQIAEKWVKAAAILPHVEGPHGVRQADRACPTSRGWPNLRTRTSTTAPWSPSTTRPASSSPTSAAPTTTRPTPRQAVPAPVRRARRRLAAGRVGLQAVQLRDRHQRRDDDGRHDVHGRHHELRHEASLHARPTPTTSSAGPCGCARRSQFSLNIPAVKALSYNGVDHVVPHGQAVRHGLQIRTGPGRPVADPGHAGGPPGRSRDRPTATLANQGHYIGHTTILRIEGPARQGRRLARTRRPPARRSSSQQAAYIITDILAGNTDPEHQPLLGRVQAHRDSDGTRRPATLKTGTNNDASDLNAYGFIAPPDDGRAGTPASTRSPWGPGTATATTPGQHPQEPARSPRRHRRSSGRASWRRRPGPGRSTSSPSRRAS